MKLKATLAIACLVTSAALAETAPSAQTKAVQESFRTAAPFADTRDETFARQGFLGTRKDPLIKTSDGRVVWDLNAFDFLKDKAAPTVNPSLWRHARLTALHGLFQVSDRIYQVRGFDIANATFVKGDTGWIVIDPLGSAEVGKAALDLVNEKLGKRPVVAVIYTHPHIDHFGGAAGVIDPADAVSGKVKVIAPKGFEAAAIGENIVAGPAMQRRAIYQFGVGLPKSAAGQVSGGVGPGIAIGTASLIAPNREIAKGVETLTIDGVRLTFQVMSDTEAPVELNIYFPDWHILDIAENANPTQHNVLTPRGALVRNAKLWASNLTEALDRFGGADTVIGQHGWPRFGNAEVRTYLGKQRDYYAFVHDQTVRLMNKGLTGDEIAARLKLPEPLAKEWYDRPFYGSLSFNARAVYQFYMGWYDGNPVHLAPLPPVEAGKRYVAAIGGAEKVRALAKAAYDAGDYAWAAELLNRAVYADPKDAAAKNLLAQAYEQLAWQSENAPWRNMYLTAAKELRDGFKSDFKPGPLADAISTSDLFDVIAVRLDADKAAGVNLKLAFVFTDRNEKVYVTVENGVLLHTETAPPGPVDATLIISRDDFVDGVARGASLALKVLAGAAKIEGNTAAFRTFGGLFDPPRPDFPIVTPR
jgi:alkyl sulfatase BDS1-like metallo-beta-lactamase superfamily hydrolase